MSDRRPLLGYDEEDEYEMGDAELKLTPSSSQALYEAPNVEDDSTVVTGIACVFCCHFDTHAGNRLEYSKFAQQNVQISLTGIEYKALPSGIHKIQSDFVLFRMDSLYGIACIANKKVDSAEERNARLRSVGILCRDYRALGVHFPICQKMVENFVKVNVPIFDPLDRYMRQHADIGGPVTGLDASLLRPMSDIFLEEISANVSSLVALLQYIGDSLMLVWKALLLRKRVLLYSDVPVGPACSRMHSFMHMLSGSSDVRKIIQYPRVLYYVNVNDMPQLKMSMFYCASTSEKVFSEIKEVADVYIDNATVRINDPQDAQLIKVTEVDRKHIEMFKDSLHSFDSDKGMQENSLKRAFAELNERVIRMLKTHSHSDMTLKDIESTKVFSKNDAAFVQALADLYGMQITIVKPSKCC